jgi:hypothetical protein
LEIFRFYDPQRNDLRFHRLLHDQNQVAAELVEVHFVTKGSGEGQQGALGVVFSPVEATVDEGLDAAAKWVEKGGDRQI